MKEINKEIKKTFTEMDRLMGVLYGQFRDMTNTLNKALEEKKNPDNLLAEISNMMEKLRGSEKDIETRLNHLFDTSKPSLNDEKELLYSFYELQEMLTKIVNGLPGLVDEKGEIDQELLVPLVNISEALEKLKNGEEKSIIIPGELGDGNFYELVKKSEIDELKKKLASLEAAEKDRNDQLRQLKEKEQQARNEIKTELESINSTTSPNELSAEELTDLLKRLQEMKSLLGGTNEQKLLKKTIKDDERGELKKTLSQLKIEDQRRRTKQRIADALADKGEIVLEKRVEVKQEELPNYEEELQEGYRNYSQTLDEMDSIVKIYDFESEILQVIAEQRKAYEIIIRALSLGEKAIKNKSVKKAKKAEESLMDCCKLLNIKKDFDNYKIYLKKANDFHVLTGKLKAFITEQENEKINKKSLSEQSIQENDQILIEKIAEEFAKKRLEGKTLKIIFMELEEDTNGAEAHWNEDDFSGFKIIINTNAIEREKNKIETFKILAHELAHVVVYLKEWKGLLGDESTSLSKLHPSQCHSKTFWEVFLDRDHISKENDISTFEFVRSKLPLEYQEELDDFIKVENKKGENKFARWVYFPNLEDLWGKMRRKKILKTKDQAEAKKEWDKIRRIVFQAVDDSMNIPEDEAEKKWEYLVENAHGEIRSVRVEIWQRKEVEEESDRGKYKIYVFHKIDEIIPSDLKNKLDEILIDDESGEWEETVKISMEKYTQLENRQLPSFCDEKESKKMIAQVLQLPKNTNKI